MTIPLSWIADFTTIRLPTKELSSALTFAGTKVESVRTVGEETVFDFEITSNRPDTLCVVGISREIAAIKDSSLRLPPSPPLRRSERFPIRITISDKTICSRHCALVLCDIHVKPSSQLIQQRLRLSGVHPINNVVDVTNYVMLELGIPLHAFDLDAIQPPLLMRRSKENERLTTLDGKTWTLPEGAIVIEDEKGLIDLAGLMGGKSSGITEKTTRILLHCPIYDPILIRRTSKALGLRTEASSRFEKKLDLEAPPFVISRAVELLKKEAGASISSGIKDRVLLNPSLPNIHYPLTTSKDVLGIAVSDQTATKVLTSLGFHVQKKKKDGLVVTPPSFRRDVAIKEDVAEELGRILGFSNLPKTIPAGPIPMPKELFEENEADVIRDILVRCGLSEHIGPTLLSDGKGAVPVKNPMAKDYAFLRPSLEASLRNAVNGSLRWIKRLRFFEIGKVWWPDVKTTVKETTSLGLITSVDDIRWLRGVLDIVVEGIGRPNEQAQSLVRFKVDSATLFAEINLDALLALKKTPRLYHPISPYPSAIEDVSFYLDEKIPLGVVWETLRRIDPETISSIELLDVFRGKSVPDGKKSVTIRLTYQSITHTLKEKEIVVLREKLVSALEKNFHVSTRRVDSP